MSPSADASGSMLRRGDSVPHFTVTQLDGATAVYADIWQRRNLLLVCLPVDDPAGARWYAAQLTNRLPELIAADAAVVITSTAIPGVRAPAALVADRWGEIHFVQRASAAAELPDPGELTEWLRYVQIRCPECEGEAR